MLKKVTTREMITVSDVASIEKPPYESTLDRVGMAKIECPFRVRNDKHELIVVSGVLNLFVNLQDPTKKGIHMSRLYLAARDYLLDKEVTPDLLHKLLITLKNSQAGLSSLSEITLNFDYYLDRPALLSDNSGFRYYPIEIVASLDNDDFTYETSIMVVYSSTCPCSAALARDLIKESFEQQYSGRENITISEMSDWLMSSQSIVATPHSQRSHGTVKLKFKNTSEIKPLHAYINLFEDTLATPVQTAVKREDEQRFALLNGQNNMFCEDAARKIKQLLDTDSNLKDYYIKVEHFESLHAHDAVAVTVKGLSNGYTPKY